MERCLQHPGAWCFMLVIVGAGLAIVLHTAPTQPARAEPSTPFGKAYVETIPGSSVQFTMLPIPEGTYLMGSPRSEGGRSADEGPQHPVRIRSFWMGKTEVTWEEYDQYWKTQEEGATPAKETEPKGADAITRPTPPYADETFGHGREGRPVLCITHHAAMEYCRWLSQRTGKIYRLPTEAEWEYACRAGSTTPYFFGSEPKKLGDYAWYAANSEEMTHPVGQKKPNPWGLCDMLGNVAEWCLDMYRKDFYACFPVDRPTVGPVLLPNADRFPHVARGGSWLDDPPRLRCAARRGSDATWIKRDPQRPQSIWWLTDAEFVGFRIVRPVAEQDNLKGIRSRVTRESR